MLEREEVKRDALGHWLHSVLAREENTDKHWSDIPESEGMEIDLLSPNEDEFPHNPDGLTDISNWHPDPPDGAGWFPIAFGENEDGPFAIYARPGSPKEKSVDEISFEQIAKARAPGTVVLKERLEELKARLDEPRDELIFCPNCHMQHIDVPEPDICECGHAKARHRLVPLTHNEGTACLAPNGQAQHEFCPCEEFKIAWNNPPHKSHKCHFCKDVDGNPTVFRLAGHATNGVAKLLPRGSHDTWDPGTRYGMTEVEIVGENDHGYQFGIGWRHGQRLGFALGWTGENQAVFFIESDPALTFIYERLISYVHAVACDPEHAYGGISRWFVDERLRTNGKEFRCKQCGSLACGGACMNELEVSK